MVHTFEWRNCSISYRQYTFYHKIPSIPWFAALETKPEKSLCGISHADFHFNSWWIDSFSCRTFISSTFMKSHCQKSISSCEIWNTSISRVKLFIIIIAELVYIMIHTWPWRGSIAIVKPTGLGITTLGSCWEASGSLNWNSCDEMLYPFSVGYWSSKTYIIIHALSAYRKHKNKGNRVVYIWPTNQRHVKCPTYLITWW